MFRNHPRRRRFALNLALAAMALFVGAACIDECDDSKNQRPFGFDMLTPAPTLAPGETRTPTTVTPGPAATAPVVTATVTPPPSEYRYATVSPIRARFDQATFTTTYRVTVTGAFPQGGSLTWSGPNCGSVRDESWNIGAAQREDSTVNEVTFAWSHPHPPCATGNHDDATIVATLSEGGGRAPRLRTICTYKGSESGTGPACQITREQ